MATTVNYTSISSDGSLLLVATNTGFSVYQLNLDFTLKIKRVIEGGVKLVQNVNLSQFFLIVRGDNKLGRNTNKIEIWNDQKQEFFATIEF